MENNAFNKKIYIKKSKISGRGIFAKDDIKKNEVIFMVKGEMVNYAYGRDYQFGSRWLGIGQNAWISPMRSNP